METLHNGIYLADSLKGIIGEVGIWNYKKVNGIGFSRKHDKYAMLELTICEFDNYEDNESLDNHFGSYLNWKVDENQFPKEYYEIGKSELLLYAQFINDWFSSIKGKRANLIYEISFAGYHPTDAWGRGAVGAAFLNVIISCFDNDLYKIGLEKKVKNHKLKDGVYQSVYSP